MQTQDLSKFEKKLIIRQIQREDFKTIIELQKICFKNMIPWKIDQLESHLNIFPEGQFCVEYDGVVIGSCSSLIVNFDEYNDQHSWDEITDGGYITNHNPDGYNLYGMEVMVHPDYRNMKIGKRLYEARQELAEQLNLKSIIIGGRIPGYKDYADQMSARAYTQQVKDLNIYDPILSFQLRCGFSLKRIIRKYMPDDKASLQYATLMEWNNIEYQSKGTHQFKTAFHVRICVIQYMMKKINAFEEFAHQCEYYVDVAANYKSDFVVFPEIFTTQLLSFVDQETSSQSVRMLTTFTDKYIAMFTDFAVRYNVNIIGGSHFVEENGHIYNIAYLFRRDGTIDKQYKLHVTPNEKQWWGISTGDNIKVFDTDCGKIAILICYDIEFPELARLVTQKGANIIFTPFCTDERQGYLRVRYCAQARAVENQVYTVIAGTVGNLTHVENMDIQYAQSAIFTPSDFSFPRDGIMAECTPNIETVIVGDIDLELLKRSRTSGTVTLLKNRRIDLYELKEKKDE
ncbi:bifunctional GNAT family N-acetyltransferase/carbon-nitrogen hydrolase family protein [Fusibacter bizertensis]|jgi:Predicted amidohydrolase|uniref:Bifunctional GNAT family N-acetyltransferase/carbon-nitrogen hydrolase family protein n=1 Tax=Fusibacter bizertensis TaxID=1488331 RepID=A0ABT6NBW1_9FIRM|nr:bifunctional GNAT family N-acetyltransferase/carbon-nitrogen hydrolase family protein [Fusibacter bizertensis]MDH8677907.1 bifunctional GNAT family N-acetyltransferase/carbon-nitrogen hydrolase family protein [Fusibacter bizertensis]